MDIKPTFDISFIYHKRGRLRQRGAFSLDRGYFIKESFEWTFNSSIKVFDINYAFYKQDMFPGIKFGENQGPNFDAAGITIGLRILSTLPKKYNNIPKFY